MSSQSHADLGLGATILIVDPDESSVNELSEVLVQEQFRPVAARTGNEAISRLADIEPKLVLMELALPDMGGLGLCRYIRAQGMVPVFVVSGNNAEEPALASFEAGADGYLTKPLRPRELIARIGAALRRAQQTDSHRSRPKRDGRVYVVGDITLDADRHEVWVGARQVMLALREFQLLEALVASPGKVWTRDALMRRVWGETPSSGTKTLGVHVTRIRARIEDNPSVPTRILTVRGVGYTYAAGPTDSSRLNALS